MFGNLPHRRIRFQGGLKTELVHIDRWKIARADAEQKLSSLSGLSIPHQPVFKAESVIGAFFIVEFQAIFAHIAFEMSDPFHQL